MPGRKSTTARTARSARSAITGRYVTLAHAKRAPRTTVVSTVRKKK